jgi:hypothetical protein
MKGGLIGSCSFTKGRLTSDPYGGRIPISFPSGGKESIIFSPFEKGGCKGDFHVLELEALALHFNLFPGISRGEF